MSVEAIRDAIDEAERQLAEKDEECGRVGAIARMSSMPRGSLII